MVIAEFARLALPGRLFLNIHPATLTERRLINGHTLSCLEKHGVDVGRVVVEITETHPIHDLWLFQEALNHYREQGFKVALDDLGSGYSGLKVWAESNPDFVKVDRHFVRGVDTDKTKQRFILAILEIAKSMGCETITEGIETKNEYTTLRKLGVGMAQGYYFAKPTNPPALSVEPGLFSQRRARTTSLPHHRLTAMSLLKARPTIDSASGIDKLGEMFHMNPDIRSVPVVDACQPHGLIVRDDFMSLLASRYGRDLNHRKPVRHFIQKRCLMVEKDESLEAISQRLTSALNHYSDEFIITDNGGYLGMGSLMDLLGKITELQVTRARYSNPLTLLPGNVVIQQMLEDALAQSAEFAVAYIDIDNFKAFNDAYGYGHGDEVLRLLGRLLQEQSEPERDFVGHIGGDDFLLLVWGEDWALRLQRVVESFGLLIEGHYSAEDRARRGITATDRFGVDRHFPIMSLSMGVLWIKGDHRSLSAERVAELATAAKSRAKHHQNSYICIDVYDSGRTIDLWEEARV